MLFGKAQAKNAGLLLAFMSISICSITGATNSAAAQSNVETSERLAPACRAIKEKLNYIAVPGYQGGVVITRILFDNEGKVKSFIIVKHPQDKKTGKTSGVADLAVQIAVKSLPPIQAVKDLNASKPLWLYAIFDSRSMAKNNRARTQYIVSDKLGEYEQMVEH